MRMRSADPRPRSRGTPSSGRRRRSYSALVSVSRIPRGRQMQFILVKRNALPPPRGDQGPFHPTQNVTKALFGLILWRNDGWIPFLLRTLLCLCGEYEMPTHCYVHPCLLILRCAYTNIEVCHPVPHKGQCGSQSQSIFCLQRSLFQDLTRVPQYFGSAKLPLTYLSIIFAPWEKLVAVVSLSTRCD